MVSDTHRRVVEQLREADGPLDRDELAERVDARAESLDDAIDYLRGRQVLRYVADVEGYELTEWPRRQECASCGEAIQSDDYVELTVKQHDADTDGRTSLSLHVDCADRVLADLDGNGQ
jgi:predicted Zn-ribbon and HTH transcriptional regulator